MVTCGHDPWLPPDERQSFPGKFTGSISQTELSIWFPEATVPLLGMQDFPLASCLCLCQAKSGVWSPGRGFQGLLRNCTHLAMFTGQGGSVGMIPRPFRKIFSEVVFDRTVKSGVPNAHAPCLWPCECAQDRVLGALLGGAGTAMSQYQSARTAVRTSVAEGECSPLVPLGCQGSCPASSPG